MERYKPLIGDMVWVEGKNPESYAYMIDLKEWEDWNEEDSRANALVLDTDDDHALLVYFNGEGTESFELDFFSRKEDHVWKIRGELI